MNCLQRISLLLGGAVLAVAVPARAQQTTTFTLTNNFSSDGTVVITNDSGASWEDVYAGEYGATINGSTVNVYCVDPAHEISGGQSYTTDDSQTITGAAGSLQNVGGGEYYSGGMASAMNNADLSPSNLNTVSGAERADEVAYLANSYLNASSSTFNGASGTTNFDTNQTAVQLAIWDIVSDGGYSGGQILDGNFALGCGTSSLDIGAMDYYVALAAEYDTTTSANAVWDQAPITTSPSGLESHYQDFVNTSRTPLDIVPAVPEPRLSVLLAALAIALVFMQLIRSRKSVV